MHAQLLPRLGRLSTAPACSPVALVSHATSSPNLIHILPIINIFILSYLDRLYREDSRQTAERVDRNLIYQYVFIYLLFIYGHLYSAFSIVQCSNALIYQYVFGGLLSADNRYVPSFLTHSQCSLLLYITCAMVAMVPVVCIFRCLIPV